MLELFRNIDKGSVINRKSSTRLLRKHLLQVRKRQQV